MPPTALCNLGYNWSFVINLQDSHELNNLVRKNITHLVGIRKCVEAQLANNKCMILRRKLYDSFTVIYMMKKGRRDREGWVPRARVWGHRIWKQTQN